MEREEIIEELSLLLMYLTAFQEEKGEETALRTWKNYSFEAVDNLVDKGYILTRHGNKSAYFLDEGIAKAKEIAAAYGIKVD